MLDKVLRIGWLYDFYGSLLTDKQQYCLEMHYLHDLSLSEIADEMKVSRQAVYDVIKRAEQILEEYEERLGLVKRYQCQNQMIKQAFDLINSLPDNIKQTANLIQAMDILDHLLYEKGGSEN